MKKLSELKVEVFEYESIKYARQVSNGYTVWITYPDAERVDDETVVKLEQEYIRLKSDY